MEFETRQAQAEIPATKKPRLSTPDEMLGAQPNETPQKSDEASVDSENVEIMEIKTEIAAEAVDEDAAPQSTSNPNGIFQFITDPRKRLLLALESGYLTDVTIFVQDEAIQCHSTIVSLASPKLAAFLKNKELRLPDVEPHHFRLLLQIIYNGKTTDPQDVTSLLNVGRVANELEVYVAVSFCASNLAKKLDSENVWRIFDFAHLIADAKLEENCLETICNDAGSILQTEGFLHCSRATLESILKQDNLCNVTELQIFQACVAWANENSSEYGSRQAALSSVLRWIRFRTLSATDFAIYVCPTGLLSAEYERDIMRSCLTGENYMPIGASIQTLPRSSQREILEIKIPTSGQRKVLETFQENGTSLRFSVNHNTCILGVKMRAWRSNETCDAYEENVRVYLKERTSFFSDFLAEATFQRQVKKGELFSIKFTRPCEISSDTTYFLLVRYVRKGEKYRTCDLYRKQSLEESKNGLIIRVLHDTVALPDLHLIIAESES